MVPLGQAWCWQELSKCVPISNVMALQATSHTSPGTAEGGMVQKASYEPGPIQGYNAGISASKQTSLA